MFFFVSHAFGLPARALASFLTGLFLSLLLGQPLIRFLTARQAAQAIRCFGPQAHLQKVGTPTLGGLLLIFATTCACLLWGDLSNAFLVLLLAVLWLYGFIGFLDDYRKITGGSYHGLTARYKYLLQSLCALVVIVAFLVIGRQQPFDLFGHFILPLNTFFYYPLGLLGFVVLSYFVLVGSSNAVNLTDGLDGLSVSLTILALCFFSVLLICINDVHTPVLDFLSLVPHLKEVLIFCTGLIGSCLGFLWFNAHPAALFMGDVGSLSLGGVLGALAILLRQEFLFFFVGLIFVLETLSVIIQLFSIRVFQRKIFLMAPFHHHFELKGWSETKVVTRFWIITFLMVILCLFAFFYNR